jgi:hypothetical protein
VPQLNQILANLKWYRRHTNTAGETMWLEVGNDAWMVEFDFVRQTYLIVEFIELNGQPSMMEFQYGEYLPYSLSVLDSYIQNAEQLR